MSDISKSILREVIHFELVKSMTIAFRYDLDKERLERIHRDSLSYMTDQGANFTQAFYIAFNDELLLYGDPLYRKEIEIKGIKRHRIGEPE